MACKFLADGVLITTYAGGYVWFVVWILQLCASTEATVGIAASGMTGPMFPLFPIFCIIGGKPTWARPFFNHGQRLIAYVFSIPVFGLLFVVPIMYMCISEAIFSSQCYTDAPQKPAISALVMFVSIMYLGLLYLSHTVMRHMVLQDNGQAEVYSEI